MKRLLFCEYKLDFLWAKLNDKTAVSVDAVESKFLSERCYASTGRTLVLKIEDITERKMKKLR